MNTFDFDPEISLITFTSADIIATSGIEDSGWEGSEGDWE